MTQQHNVPSFFNFSKAAKATTPKANVNITLCVPSAPFNRYHGTSLITAKNRSCKKYLIRFRVYLNPSATKNANTGKAMRPKQRMPS